MNTTVIQAVAALVIVIASPLAAHADSVKVEQLPRVVITGKAQPAAQQIVQLPRVVIEGRSSTLLALNSATKPTSRHI